MKRKAVRLVSLDLDGTLFNADGICSSYTADVLRRLRSKGILVMINSGRPMYSIKQRVPSGTYDYASTRNGQEIFDMRNGTSWNNPLLTRNDAEEIFGLGIRYPILFNCFFEDHTVLASAERYKIPALIIRGILNRRRHIRNQESILYCTRFEDTGIDSVPKICFSGSYRNLLRLDQKLDHERFHGCFVGKGWYEIMEHSVSKGNALRQVLEKEGLSAQETCAIGDGENDLDMLAASGLGVAMENAMPVLKKCADEIAPSNRIDGAARWLEKNFL